MARPACDQLGGRRAGDQREPGELRAGEPVGQVRQRVLGQRPGQRVRVGVGDVVEGQQLRQRAVGQRVGLGRGQRGVGAGRAADGLRGVVDQDVQRPGLDDRVGQRHHLRRIAQVDPDDPQPVQPVARCPAWR